MTFFKIILCSFGLITFAYLIVPWIGFLCVFYWNWCIKKQAELSNKK